MSFEDKSLQCSDCGATFIFSADEQEFLHSKGKSEEPKRCVSCRALKKTQRYGDGDLSYRSRSWE